MRKIAYDKKTVQLTLAGYIQKEINMKKIRGTLRWDWRTSQCQLHAQRTPDIVPSHRLQMVPEDFEWHQSVWSAQ